MIAGEDERFMRAALAVGVRELGATWPNPAVGAVIVRDGRVVSRGWTQAGGRPHAEAMAVARAGEGARGATLYVTLEPCSHHGRTPPCAEAILDSGIARVVSAIEDPNPLVAGEGHRRLREAGVGIKIGVCAEQARRAHAGHISRITLKRPRILLKFAVSADGKAAFAGGRQAQITDETSRSHVHMMRARTDAIMIGVGTALADDPDLTCRLPGMEARSPVRIVVDSHLRLPPESRLVRTAADVPVWVISSVDAPPDAERRLRESGVEVMRVGGEGGRLDLPEAVRLLATLGISRLMVEGGPALAEAFLAARLVDDAAILEGVVRLGPHAPEAFVNGADARLRAAGLAAAGSHVLGADRITLYHRD